MNHSEHNKQSEVNADFCEYNKKMANTHLHLYFMAAQSFDKAILALSSLTLGFTFTFVKAYMGVIQYKCLLFISWGCYALTAFLILITFIFVEHHALHRFGYFSRKALNKKAVELSHWTDGWLKELQYISAVIYMTGLVAFIVFVSLNVK